VKVLYTINGSIVFNTDDSTLRHIPTKDTVQINLPSARLLALILDSNGDILTREYLIVEVWDKHNLRGSNANLTQYLSIMRRALSAFGCDEIVITIPKIGIKLNTNHSVVKSPSFDGIESSPPAHLPKALLNKPGSFLSWKVIVLCLYIISPVFIATAVLVFKNNTSSLDNINIYLKSDFLAEGCEVVFVKDLNENKMKEVKSKITALLAENNLVCDKNKKIYFDNYTSFSPKDDGRTLISYCKLGKERNVTSCNNFFRINEN